MEQWILWTFLLALTAFILSVLAFKQQDDESRDSGRIALRSVEALANKLGFRLEQYNGLDETLVLNKVFDSKLGVYCDLESSYKQDKTPATSAELFIHKQDFSILLDHPGLEFVEEGRKLVKKKANK